MNSNLSKTVLKRFDKSANKYNSQAEIQKIFAKRLAKECSRFSIPNGIWADLGSGTGLLANEIEKYYPNQSVIRVDGCPTMLSKHPIEKTSQIWDLNLGLPSWPKKPSLLASSFALHWLLRPDRKLRDWFEALRKEGLLAISVPIAGSFPEWEEASHKAGIKFTALPLPSRVSLISSLPKSNLIHEEIIRITQKRTKAISLLKPIVKAGAYTNPFPKLNISERRKLLRIWDKSRQNNTVTLTWSIQLLIARK